MRLKALLFVALLALPLSAAAMEARTGENVTLDGAVTDMAFAAGQQVRVTVQSPDDVFAAGRDIEIDGASADHLIAAGREITIRSSTPRDALLAAGEITLSSGTIADDLVAAAGEMKLEAGASIGGSAMIAGGEIEIASPIAGDLTAAGGELTLNGAVGGTARLTGAEITIGPNARITGDLHLRGREITISPQAVITGRTTREALPQHEERDGPNWIVLGLLVLGLLLQHGVIAGFLPALMNGAATRLSTRFWPTLGIGALIFLALPFAIILLMVTVIGVPLAFFLLAACFVLIPLAFTAVSYWIGRLIAGRVNRNAAEPGFWARFGWTMLGALIVFLLCCIPIVGFFVWLIAAMAGIGALLAQARSPQEPLPAAT